MSIELIGARVNEIGRLVLPLDDAKGRKVFFQEFFKTAVGRQLAPYVSGSAEQRIAEVVENWFVTDVEITIPQLEKVVASLLAVRDPAVVPAEPEQPVAVAESRPRNADGTFRSEFDVWASDRNRSMKEIRDRASRDLEFRAWFEGVTIGQTLQDGGLRIVGAPTRTPTAADQQVLGEFVRLYRLAPSSSLKPLNGFITLGGQRYTSAEFERQITQASAVGLL